MKMEKYLCFGIATKIIIKNSLKCKDEKLEEKLKRLECNLDLNLYDIHYTDNSIILEIKKDIFEKNAIKFIIEQWTNIEYKDRLYIIDQYLILADSKYGRLIEIATDRIIPSLRFFKSENVFNDISYIDTLRESDILCDLFCYLVDSKISIQNEECALNYLRKCIIESSRNPIKKAAVISISENRD